MEKIDRDFPLFVLAIVIFERQKYVEKLIPAAGALKLRYWIHEGVNLHSREIRKQLGPFAFLHHPEKRARFMQDVNNSQLLVEHAQLTGSKIAAFGRRPRASLAGARNRISTL